MNYDRLRQEIRGAARHKKHLTKRNMKKVTMVFASLVLVYLSWAILWAARLEIPDFSNFEQRKVIQSTKIYDKTGTILLNSVNENIRRSSVKLSEISPFIQKAAVAIEDSSFYSHPGVQPKAILRAFLANLTSTTRTQGGSTITQQVVKNALLTNERTITRKIREAILALKLERVLSKEQILELYLNESPYGGNIYGVEEASQVFFAKSAKDVTLAEAAYLAALPQAPTRYSPYGTHTDELTARKNLVLNRMQELGLATADEVKLAKEENVTFSPHENRGIKAPHFVFYVRSYLEEKYGQEVVETGGLKVISTLDYEMQKKAEEIVAQYAIQNEKNFNAHNAGVVILDPRNGNILAMVGSRDYFEEGQGAFNITTAQRQPGSAFKPIAYATAFNMGYTPETVLFDLETEFESGCGTNSKATTDNKCYKPQNFDNQFRGPMTLRDALAQSINIPALKILYLAGIRNAIKTARDMGITSLTNPDRYGLTVVLGGGEVSLLELSSAYGVFANDGARVPLQKIINVTDRTGTILEEGEVSSQQVLPQNTARLISSILSDNKARMPTYGARSPLYFDGRDVAVKTGTTEDYRDTWIIGYTPEVVIGAWVGNNDNSPMEKRVAGFVVAPMWNAITKEIIKSIPETNFPEPEPPEDDLVPVLRGIWQGGTTYKIDKISGKLATEYTPAELVEERVVPEIHTILHWVNKSDPRNGVPNRNDPQYKLWEEPIRRWALSHGYGNPASTTVPTLSDDVHTPQNIPTVSIINPLPNSSFGPDTPVNISVNAQGVYPIDEMTVSVNENIVASTKSAPWSVVFMPRSITDTQKITELKISVYDSVRNRKDIILPVNIDTGIVLDNQEVQTELP